MWKKIQRKIETKNKSSTSSDTNDIKQHTYQNKKIKQYGEASLDGWSTCWSKQTTERLRRTHTHTERERERESCAVKRGRRIY